MLRPQKGDTLAPDLRPRQVIALGGGGFSMEPENLALDQYILSQCTADEPVVCFLPTAAGDDSRYIANFYCAYCTFRTRLTHLSLFSPNTRDLRGMLLSADIVLVGGGNTRSMLALWREWEVDSILREAYDQGTILAGLSAGSICWFEQGLSDYFPGELNPIDGLGFIKGSHCPHFHDEPLRKTAYHTAVQGGTIAAGVAADDGVALHYIDGELAHVLTSRASAKAYRVTPGEAGAHEEIIEPRLLDR